MFAGKVEWGGEPSATRKVACLEVGMPYTQRSRRKTGWMARQGKKVEGEAVRRVLSQESEAML
jgi:hypothetical protein